MTKKATARVRKADATFEEIKTPPQGKLRKLVIRNFGPIGLDGVEIDLDQIVVLVGPNNAGKSTILKAYEKIMAGPRPTLCIDEFPNGKVDPDHLPQVDLHTEFSSDADVPTHWAHVDEESGKKTVRERWTWHAPEQPAVRQGFDVEAGGWSDKKPWGFDNVANTRRPVPYRVQAFASPEEEVEEVAKLLLGGIKEQLRTLPRTVQNGEGQEELTAYGALLHSLGALQKTLVEGAQEKVAQAESFLTNFVGQIFSGYKVTFDARPEDRLEDAFSFFKAGAQLRMGPASGFQSAAEHQGSGARRALLWATLRYRAEHGKKTEPDRSNLLLLDEPELCLHPNAVREACCTLYKLADEGQWQVMITTHSPAFIDLARDNTTVVRVERDELGKVRGTTVFRPEKVKLDADEKAELKLLNLFDPSVAEFLFGGHTILVEGDTEYTAFKYVASQCDPQRFRNIHIIRARGKVTIALLARILNQFNAAYAIVHDSDKPTATRKGKEIANPAWSNNIKILEQVNAAMPGRVRLLANLPHFEGAMFQNEAENDKPYGALKRLKTDTTALQRVQQLLVSLVDFDHVPPATCCEWSDLEVLQKSLTDLSALA